LESSKDQIKKAKLKRTNKRKDLQALKDNEIFALENFKEKYITRGKQSVANL
jgi:hypothetical protein